MHPTNTAQPVTDVGEFITDLDGGQFDRMLGVALSQVAAACVDNDKTGQVQVTFSISPIKGTHQVSVGHKLKFVRPTMHGKAGEEAERETVMHVGKGGRLSLTQPSLTGLQQGIPL